MKIFSLANWSIRYKLIFIIGLTLWLAMTIATIAFIAFDQRSAQKSLTNEAIILSKVIAERSGAAVLFSDNKTARSNLGTFSIHPAVLNACLFDKKENLVAAYYRDENSEKCEPLAKTSKGKAGSEKIGDQVAVYSPVLVKGNEVGAISMWVSLDSVHARFWTFSGLAILIQMLAGLLAYWLTYRLQASVVGPIQQLRDVTNDVSQNHDYSLRATQQTYDEVGDLVAGFNDMLHTIQASHFQLKEAMQELDDKREQSVALAQSSESRRQQISDYFAGASHDLKQPLNAMGLYIEELQALGKKSTSSSVMLGKLSQSMDNLETLLNELLDASKLEEGVKKPKLHMICLKSLCSKIAHEMTILAKDKSLQFRLHFPKDNELMVHSDALMLERVIRNLVSNSIRYTEHGGVLLAIRRLRSSGGYSIETWDTGIGIPISRQTSIFDSHVQLNNEAQSASKGFGLGLSIVKRLTHSLDYPLSFNSTVNKGTVFKIQIPSFSSKKVDGRDQTDGEEVITSVDPLQGCKVLLVDDDVDVLVAMEAVFERWGVSVELADSYCSAKEYFDSLAGPKNSETNFPRFVITDFNLKTKETGLDVIALTDSVAARGERFDTVVVSAESDPVIWEQLQQREIPALKKPIKPAKLRALLVNLLQRKLV